MTSEDIRPPRPTTGRVVPAFLPSQPAQAALRRLLDGHADLSALAGVLRLDRSTLHRLLSRDRLRYDAVDHIAVALGRHPYELWPEWFPDTAQPPKQGEGETETETETVPAGHGASPVLTVDEAASYLRISRGLAFAAVRDGTLPSVRIGRRILVTRRQLEALLVGQQDART